MHGSKETTVALTHIASGELASVRPFGAQIAQHQTTALLKARQLEVIRLVLHAGKRLPQHAVAGEITVQCLEGCVDFTTTVKTHRMRAGDWIHLEGGEPHALEAVESSSLLLTICLAAP